jgi:hypothetical protein
MGGYKRVKIGPQRDFRAALRTEKPDITLRTLREKPLTERGVETDTSLMRRFLLRRGLTLKRDHPGVARRIVAAAAIENARPLLRVNIRMDSSHCFASQTIHLTPRYSDNAVSVWGAVLMKPLACPARCRRTASPGGGRSLRHV